MTNFIYKLFSEEQVTELLSVQKEIYWYRYEMEITEAYVKKCKLKLLIKEYLDKNNIGYLPQFIDIVMDEVDHFGSHIENLKIK